MVRDGMLAPMPKNATFEEAATFGVAVTSVEQAMYMIMGLPLPGEKPLDGAPFILIYGGSTATGTLAIQYAKL
jgi:NADPH:quinone reductase-like Zn-dependent oxidoreductase